MISAESANLIDHRAALETVTAAFGEALERGPVNRRPATFQDWTLGQLAAHLGGVHRWAARIVETGEWFERDNEPAITVAPTEWYETSRSRLVDALRRTDPEQACWTHDARDRTVRYWHRRQLHEALVHLWDARSAADPAAAPLDDIAAAVCADGIDEVLSVFPRRAPKDTARLPGPVALHAVDADREWTVRPDWSLGQGVDEDAVAALRGPAGALLLHVWRRPVGLDAIEVSGDADAVQVFGAAPVIP